MARINKYGTEMSNVLATLRHLETFFGDGNIKEFFETLAETKGIVVTEEELETLSNTSESVIAKVESLTEDVKKVLEIIENKNEEQGELLLS